MAIKNGNIADADEVMNAFGSNFNDVAQIIFNSDYLGFDSRLGGDGAPILKNVVYDTFTSDTADTTIGFFYNSTDDSYSTVPQIESMTIFDDFPGSSLNATNWASSSSGNGSISVSGGLLHLINSSAGSLPGTAVVTSQNDMFTDIGTFGVVKLGTVIDSGISVFKVQIHDGTNTLDIYTGSPSNQEIYWEKVGDTFYYRTGSSGAWSSQDISTWATIKLRLNLSSTSGSIDITIQEVKGEILANAEIVSNYIPSESVTNLIPIFNLPTASPNTPVFFISTDNSIFESVTNKEIHRPANTGAFVNLKVTIEYDNTQQIEDQETKLSEFATKYNFY